MSATLRLVAVIAAAVLMMTVGSRAQDARPLPDRDSFFAATRENLARAQREQFAYGYKERRTDLHVNPFGSKVGTDGTSVYEVTPAPGHVFYRKLIERDGKQITGSPAEKQEPRTPRQASSGERSEVDDVVAVLELKMDRREMLAGRDAIVVTFAPRPNAKPETRGGRLARNFKGSIWIDERAHEVMRVQAVAIDDLSFGFGLIARLNEGTTASVTREPIDGGALWMPTAVRLVGAGRAMLFRKLTLDYAINWFDYRKVL